MAITDKSQDNGATADATAPLAGQPQAATVKQTAGPKLEVMPGQFSFHRGGMFSAPISGGIGSDYYNKLKTGLIEIYKGASEEVEISLLDMDNTVETALAFSSIIVAVRYKKAQELGVAYHILTLEATGNKLTPLFETINNQQVEITRVTSDAFDDILVSKVKAKVAKAFPNSIPRPVEGTVVPSTFNPEDKTAIQRLALNAGLACTTELSIIDPIFKDLNLTALISDSSLNVNIAFNRQTTTDAVGAPIRSDIIIDFASKKNNGQNQRYASPNSGDKEVNVSRVTGYVDVVWNPVNPGAMVNPWMAPQAMATQKYSPRLIVTSLQSNYSYTPGSVLLALASALTLRDDNNWIQTFRPTSTGNEIDICDIGALNIEANLSNEPSGFGTRINTKADNFKLEDLGQLVAALMQPGMIVSMDCPEIGAESWYLSVFAGAANGNVTAQNIIMDAANELTNGGFGKYFQSNSPMFVDQNNRVHLGTWRDRHGNLRDLRDIDHIAVCNLAGERSPTTIRDYSDTYLRTQYPLPLRMAARKRFIQAFTNETAVITGMAQRVTFSAPFMDALNKGIRDTGLQVRVSTPLTGSDFNNQRGVASFANQALLGAGQTFMTAGGYGWQPSGYHMGNIHGRF